MKTWITYLTATLFGLASTLLLGQFPTYGNLVQSITSVCIQLGGFILIPIVFITFAAAVASLRKDNLGGKMALSTFLWSLLSTIVLSLLGVFLFLLIPTVFPATSTAGSGTSAVVTYIEAIRKSTAIAFKPINPFYTLASAQNLLLPIVLMAWLFGYFLKPSSEMFRPAYVTMNSLSEIMYKMSASFSLFSFAFVYFASASFFAVLQSEGTIFVSAKFALTLIVISLIALLVILPVIFGLATKFKINPYRILYRSLAVMLAGLFSANIFFASPIALSLARKNNGVQKRVSSTTIPVNVIFSRGGSALIATFSTVSLIYATTNTVPSIGLLITIALMSALISFISSAYLGYEVFFITYLTFKILGIDLHGAEMTMIGLLPLLCGFGTMIDSYIALLGSSVTSCSLNTNSYVLYEDIL